MANAVDKLGWKLMGGASAAAAATATRKAAERVYQAGIGEAPPENPSSPQVPLRQAILWAALVGGRRRAGAAAGRAHGSGRLGPGPRRAASRAAQPRRRQRTTSPPASPADTADRGHPRKRRRRDRLRRRSGTRRTAARAAALTSVALVTRAPGAHRRSSIRQLHAFVELRRDGRPRGGRCGRPGAGDGDERPLLGIPLAVKNSVAVEGIATRHGTRFRRGAGGAATPISSARCAAPGCLILGVTTMPELALHPYGPARNPWDTSRTAGGSSSGSAAAVAAGLIPAATASDGGGSIRIPAASCGLFGLKPTPGPAARRAGAFGLARAVGARASSPEASPTPGCCSTRSAPRAATRRRPHRVRDGPLRIAVSDAVRVSGAARRTRVQRPSPRPPNVWPRWATPSPRRGAGVRVPGAGVRPALPAQRPRQRGAAGRSAAAVAGRADARAARPARLARGGAARAPAG